MRYFFPNVKFSAKIHISMNMAMVTAFFDWLESQLGVDIAKASQF
jgi:hypothetical protein